MNSTELLAYNRRIIADFRASGRRMADRPLLLLTTTGARSGEPRTSPLMFADLSAGLVLIASHEGADTHPNWYHNLVAHPDVTIETNGEIWPGTARVLTGAEREATWAELVAAHPFFTEHQAKTTRQIPLVVVTRTDTPSV